MRILVIGSGGREHALCWAIAASPLCDAPRFADNLSRELMKLWVEWCEARTKGAA